MASWARLALAPAVTICPPSTFCLWPTLAAARGFTPAGFFAAAHHAARVLPNFSVPATDGFVSFRQLMSHGPSVVGNTPHRGAGLTSRPARAASCDPMALERALVELRVVHPSAHKR